MTGTTVITTRARPILDDTVSGATERWSDELLVTWLNDGARLIATMKPESLLTAFYTLAVYADIAVIADTVVLGDRYRESLVDYVVARALNQEAQDEHDHARSTAHFEQFIIKAGLPRNLVIQGRSA